MAAISGMRNRLIHAYFDVNLDTLWTTVTDDFPPLIAAVQLLIGCKRGRLIRGAVFDSVWITPGSR